jgi:ElaB/YqjD/DUF883 family membrane-anchored ribosome-binding protein
MESQVIENAADAAIKFAHLTHEVSKAKTLVQDAVEDGRRKAQRIARRGYVAAEDFAEDASYYIKRHPWRSMGIALWVGAGAGLLAGWFCTRTRKA